MKRECLVCKKQFEAKPAEVRDGGGKYCSRKCYWKSSRNHIPWNKGLKGIPKKADDKQIANLYKQGLDIAQIMKKTKLSKVPIYNSLRRTKTKLREQTDTKVELTCKECGKRFKAYPSELKKNRKYCSEKCGHNSQIGVSKYDIKQIREIAKKRDGKCLSDTYRNNRTKLKWMCAKGHTWEAVLSSVNQGRWCPYCAGQNPTIKDMQDIAKSKGGKCLSTKYTSMRLSQFLHIFKC